MVSAPMEQDTLGKLTGKNSKLDGGAFQGNQPRSHQFANVGIAETSEFGDIFNTLGGDLWFCYCTHDRWIGEFSLSTAIHW